MLPDMKSNAGLQQLKELGYPIKDFTAPRHYQKQAELFDTGIKAINTDSPIIFHDISHLLLDCLLRSPHGLEFFSRFPTEEIHQFCRLAVESRVHRAPFPVACPVCPDYEERGYKMSNGVGIAMERVFARLDDLAQLFGSRNLPFSVEVHVADVEALEPLILRASGESEVSFLSKTEQTIAAITDKAKRLGLEKVIQVKSMLGKFAESGLNYAVLKKENKRKIFLEREKRKIRKALDGLINERVRLGDYDTRVGTENYTVMAAEELADYATYNDLINGRSVILSPDASSAMPAYNFLRGDEEKQFSSTIHVRNVKMTHDNFD